MLPVNSTSRATETGLLGPCTEKIRLSGFLDRDFAAPLPAVATAFQHDGGWLTIRSTVQVCRCRWLCGCVTVVAGGGV